MEGEVYNLTNFNNSYKLNKDIDIKEIASLQLICKENKFDKLEEFCKENDIEMHVSVGSRFIIYKNEVVKTDKDVFEDYMLDEYFNKVKKYKEGE